MVIITLLKHAPLLDVKLGMHGTLVKNLEREQCMRRVGTPDCIHLGLTYGILRPGQDG